MAGLFDLLLRLLAGSGDSALVRQNEFLKLQLRLYHHRHGSLRLTNEQKRRMVALGENIVGVAALLVVVSYSTFRRWVRTFGPAAAPPGERRRAIGRPRTPDDIRDLVLTLARANAWGYTPILGELKKLGVTTSRSTVVNILRQSGIEPQPRRGVENWTGFVKAHAETLWQCDFFSRHVVTLTGLRQCFVLVFLHVATRRVFITPCSFKPDAEWMKTQAQAFIEHAMAQGLTAEILVRDNDGMYTEPFDGALKAAGCEVKRTAVRAPNMNAYVERFNRSIQEECLERFIIFGREHFDLLVREYVAHYHEERPHQGKENRLLTEPPPDDPSAGKVLCRPRLGGVLKHYLSRRGVKYAPFHFGSDSRFSTCHGHAARD